MPPGLSGSPGRESSSPVKNAATLTLRFTFKCVKPAEAATPSSCGRRKVPAVRAVLPAVKSSPLRRIH